MRYIRSFIVVLVLLLPFTFTAFADEQKQPQATPPAGQEMKPEAQPAAPPENKSAEHDKDFKEKRLVATVGSDGIQHVEITGGEYYFDPNYIVVKVNVPVELKAKKTGGFIPHDVVVKAPDAGIDFKLDLKKEDKAVTFTPTKVGKYDMVCDERFLFFKSHKDRGMYGYIEVVP